MRVNIHSILPLLYLLDSTLAIGFYSLSKVTSLRMKECSSQPKNFAHISSFIYFNVLITIHWKSPKLLPIKSNFCFHNTLEIVIGNFLLLFSKSFMWVKKVQNVNCIRSRSKTILILLGLRGSPAQWLSDLCPVQVNCNMPEHVRRSNLLSKVIRL